MLLWLKVLDFAGGGGAVSYVHWIKRRSGAWLQKASLED
jgi:hypothetical protein